MTTAPDSPLSQTGQRISEFTNRAATAIVRFLGTRAVFIAILVIFGAGSALIALTMSLSIYDEHWHMRIIEAYSHQLGPRLENSSSTEGLGDVEFTGSFLFHWLMSFPYRVVVMVFGDGFIALVTMRMLGVAMAIGGLIVWRAALLRILPSAPVANVTVAFFASLPLFGFTSATVNYDNLLFLVTAGWFYFVARFIASNGESLLDLVWMLGLGLAGMITKYTFAPVFALVVIYLTFRYLGALIRALRMKTAISDWKRLIVPGVLFVLALAGVVSRYVVNLFAFGSPNPSCDAVESYDYCMTFDVFRRNESFTENALPGEGSPVGATSVFVAEWFPRVIATLSWVGVRTDTGAVLDTYGGDITRPLIYITAVVILAFAVLLGRVIPEKYRWPIWISLLVHSIALFLLNYGGLYQFGLLFAYSSRYFFPYLPAVIFLAVAGLAVALTKISSAPKLIALGVLLVAVLFMTQGAGPLTYLNAIDETWLHPESPIRSLALFLGRVTDRLLMIGP